MPSMLLATTGSFYPPYQGDSVRLGNLIGWFRQRGWRVHVVQWHSEDHHHADYAAMARRCDTLAVYRPDPGWWPRDSGACDDWCPDGLATAVMRACREHDADVVVAQYVFLSKCLVGLPDHVVKVLDADNLFSGRREVFTAAGFEYDWFSTTPEQERVGLRRADLVVTVQEMEARAVSALVPDRPVVLVPPAEPVTLTAGADADDLLFVSSSDTPNAHGIRRFVAEALPWIRRRHPRTRLLVAGEVSRDVPAWPGAVVPLGLVPDLRTVYHRACIVLNTTPCGTGIKSKTVRALCHGKCLVSTSAGIQGLEGHPGRYFVADSPAEFATTITRLLDDRAVIRAAGRRALAFAATYFDPDAVFGRLEKALATAQLRCSVAVSAARSRARPSAVPATQPHRQ